MFDFNYEHYEHNIEGEEQDDEIRRISRKQTATSGINALCPVPLLILAPLSAFTR
jgi:hypothetical protein